MQQQIEAIRAELDNVINESANLTHGRKVSLSEMKENMERCEEETPAFVKRMEDIFNKHSKGINKSDVEQYRELLASTQAEYIVKFRRLYH